MLVYLLTLPLIWKIFKINLKLLMNYLNLSVLHKNNNNFNDKSKKSFEIKLKLFSENLDLI